MRRSTRSPMMSRTPTQAPDRDRSEARASLPKGMKKPGLALPLNRTRDRAHRGGMTTSPTYAVSHLEESMTRDPKRTPRPKMRPPSTERPHKRRRVVSDPQRIARLRRRSGAAWARVQASGEAVAHALDLHHTSVTHRKDGEGPHANLLIEIDALERDGIDSTPLLEAVIETIANARSAERRCPKALSREEQAFDAAEDIAQVAMLSGAGSVAAWRQSLITYVARAMVTIAATAGAS